MEGKLPVSQLAFSSTPPSPKNDVDFNKLFFVFPQPAGRTHLQVGTAANWAKYSTHVSMILSALVCSCSDVTVELPLQLMHPKPTGTILYRRPVTLTVYTIYINVFF